MKNLHTYIIICTVPLLLLWGCNRKANNNSDGTIHIQRLEEVIFENSGTDRQVALVEFKEKFQSPLLTLYPDDSRYMEQIEAYAADSTVRSIYRITHEKYDNIAWLEQSLDAVLKKAHEVDDEIEIRQVATWIPALFDYKDRIAVDRDSKSIRISLDQYAIGEMEQYAFWGTPLYIVEVCDSLHLLCDIMAEVARQYIAVPENDNPTMLDFMIMEGKVLWFLDQLFPKTNEYIKIRYNKDQWHWMQQNEGNVWGYFIQHNLLYDRDFNRFHNFIDDAPKTNAFNNSAPRTTDYIGWQIVKSYMKNNRCSAKALFANSDSQIILQNSKYKP